MVIDKIWYAPPGHNNSCAPVSIYSMIHSNLVNEGASIGADLITIDGVGNSLSMNARGTFSRTFGSGLSEANIQKISRTVSRGLSKLGMEIDFKLRTDTIGLPDIINGEIREDHFVTVCFSYSFYLQYFQDENRDHPCLATVERPLDPLYSPGHCVLILGEAGGEYQLLDPNCKYSTSLVVEEKSSFLRNYSNKIVRIDREEFIGRILLGRMDSYDDQNRVVVSTVIHVRDPSRHDNFTLFDFLGTEADHV